MAATAGSDSFFARVGEYFTLSDAGQTQAKLGEPARKAMDQALSLGRQRADAAESLWSNGHTAEGLRLAVKALRDTLEAAPSYASALGAARVAAKVEPKVEPKAEAAESKEAESSEAGESDEAAKEAAESKEAEAESKEAEESKEAATDEAAESKELEESEPVAESKPIAESKAVETGADAWSASLAARGTRPAQIDRVRSALAAADKAELPTLDADVSAAHADLFQQVLDARHIVDAAFGMVALPPRDLRWTRFSRIATTSIVAIFVIGGLYFSMRTPEGVFADASDVWAQSPTFAPETVIDGNDDSYWLLPDGATGWVEARISPPASVARVRVLNIHNPPHNDRATSDYAIEVYSGGSLAETVEGHFDFSNNPEFVSHDVGVDSVDRIRFVVRGHHNLGGGLAELQWE